MRDPTPTSTVQPDPASAAAYLQDAAEALGACGSAPALYGIARTTLSSKKEASSLRNRGLDNRARFARNSILFSAISAEAYVNEFLRQRMARSDFEAVDRLSTVEKYLIGVTYAEHEPLFVRANEPVQTLRQPFDTRNALVHPKPGARTPSGVTPLAAANSLVATVAAARVLLERTTGATGIDLALCLLENRRSDLIVYVMSNLPAAFVAWGREWSATLPEFDAEDPFDGPLRAAWDRFWDEVIAEGTRRGISPDLTLTKRSPK